MKKEKTTKEGKHLRFYKQCMETGTIPKYGLCSSLSARKLSIFDSGTLAHFGYWGYDGKDRSFLNNYMGGEFRKVAFEFTPLRQTVVLLIAAMNGEL